MTTAILLVLQESGGIMGSLGMFLPIILMVGIFYFLVIMPQKKQAQQLKDMVASLKINDEIVTSGGVIGKVKEIRETSFIIQSAEKTFLEIGKSAVVGVKSDEKN